MFLVGRFFHKIAFAVEKTTGWEHFFMKVKFIESSNTGNLELLWDFLLNDLIEEELWKNSTEQNF